ncbi:hypothetical protein H4219_005412 [Mycoemilia scoparia]|uniref:Saccharopine dehydrogenase NADP binding domain-containing protein n=1 Tax=Mycoemilia scoparia TaxID=417184 RepID=A0A9W8DPD0_9FUNG|nr:hypothetical protein H4219_005412 [Mycoemilia scoparia]
MPEGDNKNNNMGERKYDILVWGASGFTGEFTAEYLALNAPSGTKVALGGRNLNKIKDMQKRVAENAPAIGDMPVLVANNNDLQALEEAVSQAKVVISTVGPYSLYGSNMVEACVNAKTDYCDITGEFPWVAEMKKKFGEKAKENGVTIVSFCGFDSIPSDLGAFMLNQYAQSRNKQLGDVKASLTYLKAGVSGGTMASMAEGIEKMVKEYFKPKSCGDKDTQEDSNKAKEDEQSEKRAKAPGHGPIHYDSGFEKWQMPWIMARVNTAVVNQAAIANKYGSRFSYYESLSVSGLIPAVTRTMGIASLIGSLAFPPTRWLAKKVLPSPGEGPSRKAIEEGGFVLDFIAPMFDSNADPQAKSDGNDEVAYGRVAGKSDPGYGETIKYVSEGALCILKNKHLNGNASPNSAPSIGSGIGSPSVLMGSVFLQHLRSLGFEFKVGDVPFEKSKL